MKIKGRNISEEYNDSYFKPAVDAYCKYQHYSTLENEEFSQELVQIMSKVEFFTKACPADMPLEDFVINCMRYLKYEELQGGHAVFNMGEKGDKFFIILKGSVNILIPRKIETVDQENEKVLRELKHLMLIDESQINSLQIEDKILKKAYIRLNISQKDIEQTLSQMKQLGLKYFTNLGVSRYLKVALLKAGKSFGEVALTTSAPRSAAIIANENLVLLSLTKEGYLKVFEAQVRAHAERHLTVGQAFRNIGVKSIQDVLSSQFKDRIFLPNQIVWNQDDDADMFYIIKDGSLTLYHKIDERKKTVPICQLQPGTIVGHYELLLGKKRQTTCQANSICKVYRLTSEQFQSLTTQYPTLIPALEKQIEKFQMFLEQRINEVLNIQETNSATEKKQNIQVKFKLINALAKNTNTERAKLVKSIFEGLYKTRLLQVNQEKLKTLQQHNNPKIDINLIEIDKRLKRKYKLNKQLEEKHRTLQENKSLPLLQSQENNDQDSYNFFNSRKIPQYARNSIYELARDKVLNERNNTSLKQAAERFRQKYEKYKTNMLTEQQVQSQKQTSHSQFRQFFKRSNQSMFEFPDLIIKSPIIFEK